MGGAEEATSVSTDNQNMIHIAGRFGGTVDFDPSSGVANYTANGGFNDIYVLKLDATASFIWARAFGGSSADDVQSISNDNSGNVYTAGELVQTMDLDPGSNTFNLSSNGNSDVFVQKLSECVQLTSTDQITACNSYTWIDNITYTSSNNTATFMMSSVDGCDSLVSLDLTINSVSSVSTTTAGITITATNTNATYQWLDCNNNYSVITGATGQSYTALANGSYAVELTENGCVDTSACVPIVSVGINESGLQNELSFYPNPTQGKIFVQLGQVENSLTAIIRNSLGQEVSREIITAQQQFELDIQGESGLYFIELIGEDDRKAVVRIMKE